MAEARVLDVDVRAVGSEIRRYNSAAARRQDEQLAAARARVVAAFARALRGGESELLALRAYQLRRFLAELGQWQRSGVASEELEQIGGDFLAALRRNGWSEGQERRLVAGEIVLRVLFKKRWNDVTGANAGAFALSLDEERVRHGFFLERPWVERDEPAPRTPLDELRREALRSQARLATIDRLGRLDPRYPADLAHGVVLYRLQRFVPAADAFRRQLERSPGGPYALRAQNYLKAALDRMREGLL